MTNWLVVVVLLGACGGSKPPPAPPQNAAPATAEAPPAKSRGDVLMEQMVSWADRMCSCVDKACADAVHVSMTKWSTERSQEAKEDPGEPDEADLKATKAIGFRYGECMRKLGASPP